MKFFGKEVDGDVVYKVGSGTVTTIKGVLAVEPPRFGDGGWCRVIGDGWSRYAKSETIFLNQREAQTAAIFSADRFIQRAETTVRKTLDSIKKMSERKRKLQAKVSSL